MVLQVLADARQIPSNGDAEVIQTGPVAKAGKLQQLGRGHRAGRQDDLAACARLERRTIRPHARHPHGAAVLEEKRVNLDADLEPEVRPLQGRFEKAAGRAPAPPGLLVHLEIAGAEIVAAVEIGGRRNAGRGAGLGEGVEHRPAHAWVLHAPFPALGVQGPRRIDVIFLAKEEGQDVVPAPAGQTHLAPAVVVRRLAAHVDHGVDRR